jgi:hypothetical protein
MHDGLRYHHDRRTGNTATEHKKLRYLGERTSWKQNISLVGLKLETKGERAKRAEILGLSGPTWCWGYQFMLDE